MHSAKSTHVRWSVTLAACRQGRFHVHKHEDVCGAVAHVLVIDPSGLPGRRPDRDTRFADQLSGGRLSVTPKLIAFAKFIESVVP